MLQKSNKTDVMEMESVKKELDEIKELRSGDSAALRSITALCTELFTIICC